MYENREFKSCIIYVDSDTRHINVEKNSNVEM